MSKDFKIKLDAKGQDFFTGVLPNVERAMKRGINQGLHQAGFNLVKTAKDGIQRGPKTGRVYTRKGRKKRASAPGEYAGIVTGDYLAAMSFEVHGASEMEFGNQDFKATYLELGTRNKDGGVRMAPRPALTLSVEVRQKDTLEVLRTAGIREVEKLGK
ncbi:MAG: hypothetical protein V3U60_16270 [Gammaproteobacteria bacterium]